MNVYDIALTVALTILAMTLYFVVDYFKDKIKKLEDYTNRILDCHKMRIDGIVDRIDHLVHIISDRMEEMHEPSKEKDRCVGVGKWVKIIHDEPYGSCYYYACSICHNRIPKNKYGHDYFSLYCPACGAKMEGWGSEVEE